MLRRWRPRVILVAAIVAVAFGALGGISTAPAVAGGTPGPLPTSDPAPPSYYEPISRVIVVASAPRSRSRGTWPSRCPRVRA
jgi:hypothetical protein